MRQDGDDGARTLIHTEIVLPNLSRWILLTLSLYILGKPVRGATATCAVKVEVHKSAASVHQLFLQ